LKKQRHTRISSISNKRAETGAEVVRKHRRVKIGIAHTRMYNVGPHAGAVPCDLCGKPATDLHHLIVRRGEVAKANVDLQLYIEHPINLVFLCVNCHTGKSDSAEAHRDELIRVQYERFGYDVVLEWVAGFEAISRLKVAMPEEEVSG